MTTSSDSVTIKQSRDRLFFDQYRYSMQFQFRHSGRMRSLDHDSIRASVEWVNITNMARMLSLTPIGTVELQQMLALATLISSIAVPYKRIVYSDCQYFYTNHAEIFADLARAKGVRHVSYSEACIDRPRDSVILEHSDYQYRSFFREKFYTRDQLTTLSQFLNSRPTQFRITNAWKKKLTHLHCYITRSFFVDHNDPRDTLLLNIALPGCVRKTVPIVIKQ